MMPVVRRSPLQFLRAILPSSGASLVCHVLVIVLATWGLRGCDQGIPGDAGGDVYHDVGLFVVPGTDPRAPGEQGTEIATESTRPVENVAAPQLSEIVPSQAPDLNALLGQPPTQATSPLLAGDAELPPLIGPGAPLSGLPSRGNAAGSPIRANGDGGDGAAGSAQLGPGQTTFMNIVDGGNSFVYVIDTSSSMGEANRLKLAGEQLKASLRLLQPTQTFQVIFYSLSPVPMRFGVRPPQPMYAATPVNLELAEREIDRATPYEGTEHFPALKAALDLQPDVIYFLTDGREPELSPAELRIVDAINRSHATIHVIEFGPGALTSRSASWLERLASESGGQYRSYPIGD